MHATFTDPGDDDPYTATIDFGDGSGPQAVVPVVTNTTPPQTGTVDGSFQYGDNGSFTVTVTVTDEDGGTGSASFLVTVTNVDPDAVIETPDPVIADVNTAVGALLAAGVSLAELKVRPRTLEDLFLELTGKELRA